MTKRSVMWGMGLIALAGLTAAHLALAAKSPVYAGFLVPLDILYNWAVVAGLAALCSALGHRLIDLLRVRTVSALELLSVSTALGGGALAISVLALGFVGWLHPAPIAAVALILAAFSYGSLRKFGRLVRACVEELADGSNPVLLSLFGVIAFFMLLQASAPPEDYDSLAYHLRVPQQWLNAGRIYLPEDNLHAAFVSLPHMLYIPLLAFGGSTAPAILSSLVAVLLGLAVFDFGRRLLGHVTGELSLVILWGSPMLVLVAITPRVDVMLAWYLLLAHFTLITCLTTARETPRLLLAAVLLGLAFGVKYGALFYIVALGPLILWASLAGSPAAVTRRLVAFSAVAIIAAAPWLTKNWLLFDAPLFPFLAQPRLPPWLAGLYGQQLVPPWVDIDGVTSSVDWRRPFNLRDLLLAPGRLSTEHEGRLFLLNPALLALPLALLKRQRMTLLVLLPALAYLVILLMWSPSTNLRYFAPALPPLTLIAVHLLVTTFSADRSAGPAGPVWTALSAMIVVPTLAISLGWSMSRRTPARLVGLISETEYLERVAYGNILGSMHRLVPEADSKVLLFFDGRGFHYDRPILADVLFRNWSLLAPIVDRTDCLADTDITHVLMAKGALEYRRMRHEIAGARPLRLEGFDRFAGQCLEPVHEEPAFALFALRRD